MNGDPSGGSGPACAFFHRLGACLAKQFDRFFLVAVRLGKRLFAIHHGQAGHFAKFLDVGRGN